MGKKSRSRPPRTAASSPPDLNAEVPVVGRREPCPCGSGRRYKACHGAAAERAAAVFVSRPFEGLPDEAQWVALREVVPAATATVRLAGEHIDQDVTVVTVLPTAVPALVRADGRILLALQTVGGSGDPSRDIAAALETALAVEPGTLVTQPGLPGPGPRLQDLLDLGAPFEVTLHEGFDFWLDGAEGGDDPTGQVAAGLEQANAIIVPTWALPGLPGAYVCRIGERLHLRWVIAEPEDRVLDALARLHARRDDELVDGSRLLGTFRAHGLLVPVWDLPPATSVVDLGEPAVAFRTRLDSALRGLADGAALTSDERRARAGLANRQVTLR